jgi:carbon storage regulator
MLVLSRKESQRIRLGDSIVITIVKISGDKVRVGIEAPSNVLVLRDELEAHEPAKELPPAADTVILRQSA